MIAQFRVRQAGGFVMLHPFHAARRKVEGRAHAVQIWQDFKRQRCDFERERWLVVGPPTQRKQFARHFPNIRIAPLHHMGCLRQALAKAVELVTIHVGSLEAWAARANAVKLKS